MARKKSFDVKSVLDWIDIFWAKECKGNTKKLTYKALAKYLNDNGMLNITEKMLRYDAEIRDHILCIIEEYKKTEDSDVVCYKTFDFKDLFEKHPNFAECEQILIERDQYYMNLAEYFVKVRVKSKKIELENDTLKEKAENLEQENNELMEKMSELRVQKKELQLQINKMKKLMKTYLYPEIANTLLRDDNFLKGGEDQITEFSKEFVMNDNDSLKQFEKKNEKMLSEFDVLNDLFDKI